MIKNGLDPPSCLEKIYFDLLHVLTKNLRTRVWENEEGQVLITASARARIKISDLEDLMYFSFPFPSPRVSWLIGDYGFKVHQVFTVRRTGEPHCSTAALMMASGLASTALRTH